MSEACPRREASLSLVREYVSNEGLIRHMLAVEAAVRAYARRFGADEHLWGTAALLHDFDYERWPNPPDHPLQGSQILRGRGYPEEVIYAILSHADFLQDEFPRRSLLDKSLYACDELSGFLMACALVRPERLTGLKPASVRKKMKQASFAAAVSRGDLLQGAADLGVEFDAHVAFCAEALEAISGELGMVAPAGD
jgi:putative nucleotidyltransferase with HDIG domain